MSERAPRPDPDDAAPGDAPGADSPGTTPPGTTPPADSPLADSPSAFLRHGATQPVDWRPWGEDAFRTARETDRPVLLDIGAVWCHWCHVMDRESYEDPDTAALINELYVPVKVDRDERPDVDARYQRAVQSLVGQGGWPLTAFLTPDGDVFHGGTYFPPRDGYGRPSYRRVLREVARVWREERSRVAEAAGAVRERLAASLEGEAAPGELRPDLVDAGVEALARVYDARRGGFGGAPKFPAVGSLALLLDRAAEPGRASGSAAAMVRDTLVAMVAGGIHDQLGGGFHRYATDARWIIPHFEKMAYDNGPLLEILSRAAVVFAEPRFTAAAEGIVGHYLDVAPELVAAGGFPASQDADLGPDDDGDYWTWTADEVAEALAPGDAEPGDPSTAGHRATADAARLRWGLDDPESAMHLDPNRHVLFQAVAPAEVARRLGRPVADVDARLDAARRTLKGVRDRRPRPFVDATLYAGWVSLVASGHLAAARHLGTPDAGDAALRALDRLWSDAWEPDVGFHHRVADSGAGIHLSDQAHTAAALLDAFEWSQDLRWLERARAAVDVILARFGHASGALLDRPADGAGPAALRQDRLEITDSPEPSPTAVAAMAFARLAALQGDDDLADAAARVTAAFAGSAPRFAASASTWFRAVRWVTGPVTTVVVVEPAERDGRSALLDAALRSARPAMVVRRLPPHSADVEAAADAADAALTALPEALRAMVTRDSPRAYVCAGRSCAAPVADADALRRLLETFPPGPI